MTNFAKAIAAAVTAFGTGLITAAAEGGITSSEWYIIAGGTLVAGAAVYRIPNSG